MFNSIFSHNDENLNLYCSCNGKDITKMLKEITIGMHPGLSGEIINACKNSNISEDLSNLFNNRIGQVLYTPKDFIIKTNRYGVIVELPNAGIDEYCMIIFLKDDELYGVENEFDGDRYFIDLTDITNGPIDCVHSSDDLLKGAKKFMQSRYKKGDSPIIIQ